MADKSERKLKFWGPGAEEKGRREVAVCPGQSGQQNTLKVS